MEGNTIKDKDGNELSWVSGEAAEDKNEDGSAKAHKVKLSLGIYQLVEESAHVQNGLCIDSNIYRSCSRHNLLYW